MNQAQKVIKYCALAFAIFLIVTIFSAIASIGVGIIKSISYVSTKNVSSINHEKYETYLDINLRYSNLKILKGETLKVINDDDKITVKEGNNKLEITDNNNFFSRKKDKELIVYIPSNLRFDIVNISSGAGRVDINDLNSEELILNLGAGKATIKDVISNKSEIETGAGSVSFVNTKLNNAKLDLGIGSINYSGLLTGDTKINCGIGRVSLMLDDYYENYTFDVEKGIGNITLNNKDIDDVNIGNGNNKIVIDGGIGSITINTK